MWAWSQAAASSGAKGNTTASDTCLAGGAVVSAALCGLNCECCAADIRLPNGGFHGTLLRSPRSHVLSQFSHCHIAHHGTWGRALLDVPLFFAESILRGTEFACGSYCTGITAADADWKPALAKKLASAASASEQVRVISLHNTQAPVNHTPYHYNIAYLYSTIPHIAPLFNTIWLFCMGNRVVYSRSGLGLGI